MLTIIHLTDIHFSEVYSNSILRKQEALFKSIIAESRGAKKVIICVSGDIANYGTANEYVDFALPFFDSLKEKIEQEIDNLICDFLFIPGNHDCDFSNKSSIDLRNDLLSALSQNPERAQDPYFVKNMIVQDHFNDFKDSFYDMYKWNACRFIETNELISRIKLEIHDKKVIFNLYNSAWISTLNEQPGKMIFPINFMDSQVTSMGDLNLSVIHHPTHWLEPNNKRKFESILQDSSDIIISGHEHVPSNVTLTDWNRRQVHFIEGSALQEIDSPEISGYNVINIDMINNLFQVKNISWKSTHYRVRDNEEVWHKIDKTKSAVANDSTALLINNKFDEFLKDVGIPILHPRKVDLQIEDVYVFPNVKEVIYENDSQTFSGPEEIPKLIHTEKMAYMLFTGDKDCGKTALAKRLFEYYYEDSYHPLYIHGEDLTSSTSKNINLLIKRNIHKNYNSEKQDLYLQLSKNERVLLIDNWHHSSLNSQTKSFFLKEANKYFKQVIFFSEINDTVTNTIDMSSKEEDYKFRHFEIMEFGHLKRDEFVENWVRLGQAETLENKNLIREMDKLKYQLRPVLMQSFVPKFPLYLLIILNTIESGTHHNLDKSSNGYYFEVLIKDSLASIKIENNETDKIYQYLTDLSYELLKTSNNSMTLQEWREFHRNHLEHYDMNEDQIVFSEIQSIFESEKVIRNNLSSYEFYYPYVFYFFIAQYFARNINNKEVKEKITTLCENLHVEENANIIMFLTHLSKDEFIKDNVINAAKKIFKDITPLKIEQDVNIINDLCDELSPLVIQDVNVREHRKKINQRLDELDEYEENNNQIAKDQYASSIEQTDSDDESEIINKINMTNKGFKMLDIIGQILRNYYGSLSGISKRELCEEHYKLGLRISHNYIKELSNQNESLVSYISSAIMEKEVEDQERAEKFARRIVYSLGGFIAYNTIGKIGSSIGTPDLDRTLTKVQQELPYNSVALINLFIKIEYYDQFPYNDLDKFYKDNIHNKIALEIIRTMVKRYLYMFETSHREKQKLCDLVGIKMSPKMLIQLKSKAK